VVVGFDQVVHGVDGAGRVGLDVGGKLALAEQVFGEKDRVEGAD
jgi:hypothetical protein